MKGDGADPRRNPQVKLPVLQQLSGNPGHTQTAWQHVRLAAVLAKGSKVEMQGGSIKC